MPLMIGAVVVVLGLVAVIIAALGAILPGSGPAACQPAPGRSATDIPATYLHLYRQAGRAYGIGWNLLAAVGKVESDHGRSPGPGISAGRNHAGAAGPMQFMPGTWTTFGVDGDHDGRTDIYNPADAIPAAARYLKHNGAPERVRTALFQYNHSHTYVNKVLHQARTYASGAAATDEVDATGCASVFSSALPPGKAAATAIAYARAQLGKPYVWGAAGPRAFDCSGLTYAAYRAAAISIPRVSGDQWQHGPRLPNGHEQPGDLVFFNTGPETSTRNPGHVGLVIGGGKMIAAPHSETVVQIQSYRRRTLLGFTRPTAQHHPGEIPQGAAR